MTASLLIGLIGLTDLLRALRGRRIRWTTVLLSWAAFTFYAIAGLAMNPVVVVLLLAVATGWIAVMPSSDSTTPRRLWPMFALGGLVLAAASLDPSVTSSAMSLTYTGLAGVFADVSVPTLVAAVAVALFLARSSNLITRAALGRAAETPGSVGGSRSERWQLRIRGAVIGDVGRSEQPESETSVLQGGRLIGPIERLLIVILALAGAFVLIAALIAAKGVVRFPEISADREKGSKAEEFLVGSLTSWSIATIASLYLASVMYL